MHPTKFIPGDVMSWVKLFRKSLDSPVFQNPNLWQVWCYCLMRANHKQSKILWNKSEIILREGEFITGRFQGAKDCNMNPNTFYLQLKTLEKLGNITISSNNKNSLVTIVNWASYQHQPENDNNKKTEETQNYNNKSNDLKPINKGQNELDLNFITTKCQQNNTDKKIKNKIIDFVFSLTETVRNSNSVYSIVNKFSVLLGEDKLLEILQGLSERQKIFENENKLASYLQACKPKEMVYDKLRTITADEPGWM